jgi:hypothetical protein
MGRGGGWDYYNKRRNNYLMVSSNLKKELNPSIALILYDNCNPTDTDTDTDSCCKQRTHKCKLNRKNRN